MGTEYEDYGLSYPEVPGVAEAECRKEGEEWQAESRQGECPPHWDRISCWPPSPEGSMATIPCFRQLNGVLYDHTKSAFLRCLPGPVWENRSDYTACTPLELSDEEEPLWEASYSASLAHIYFSGYSVSLAALTAALLIFGYFKEMRCLRNKIHSNLFLTFILGNTFWIATATMQSLQLGSHGIQVSWCVCLVLLRYFHLASFFWMFVEGLYLFVQVIATFSVENSKMKFRHYLLIGWGLPLVVVVTWAVLTQNSRSHQPRQATSCAFMEHSHLEWVYIGPVLLLLATNTFFLISIFTVVVTKLRASGERCEPADHQNWKAAKALLVIIPLLGITYIITILGPSDASSLSHSLFEHLRALLLSTQGFTVTLPYCFLNTEVRGILRHHWNRWRSNRSVEAHISRSHRNSLSLAGCHGCDTNITQLNTSRRNSFLRLHAQYLSSASQVVGREGHLVTSVVLERGGLPVLPSNRVIPVIQEEASLAASLATSPLLPPLHPTFRITPASGSLPVCPPGEDGEAPADLTLLDLSHSQPALPGPLSPSLAAPQVALSTSCPSVNIP